MDSFGNICGHTNPKFSDISEYNGIDMSDRPYVYYFDFVAEVAELTSRNQIQTTIQKRFIYYPALSSTIILFNNFLL